MSQKLITSYFELYFQIQFHLYQTTWYSGYIIYYNLRYPEIYQDLKSLIANSIDNDYTLDFEYTFDENSIIKIKTEKLEKLCNNKCPICLEIFWEIPFILNCGHFYHKECITNWEKNCPICKKC